MTGDEEPYPDKMRRHPHKSELRCNRVGEGVCMDGESSHGVQMNRSCGLTW